MARSVAVLDWKDVQSLVGMCSKSFAKKDPNFDAIEQCRRNLIESFFPYLQEWLPGRMIDDEVRRPLIQSLQDFSAALRTLMISDLASDNADSSAEEMYAECTRIRKLLRSAMSSPEDSQENDLGVAGI